MMTMTLYLLYGIMLYTSGLAADVALHQKDSESKLVGDSVQLKCQVSGYNINDHHLHWLRQTAEKSLVWISAFRTGHTTYIADSFKGRVTPSTSESTGLLKIDKLEYSDSGTYFCARGGLGLGIWGPGTFLTVTAASAQAPSLFPLISCGTSSDSSVIIGCLARDYIPSELTYSWNDKTNNSYKEGFKAYSPVLQPSGSYMSSSQIKVTSDSWLKMDSYYCTAKHSLNSKTVKLQNPNDKPKPSRPTVTLHAPVKEDMNMNGNGTIVCVMSDYYPDVIKVKWLKNHGETNLSTMEDKANVNENGKYIKSAYITVSKKEWNEDTVYSCVVEHNATGSFEIRNLSKSQACETPVAPGMIQVAVVPPSFETIFLYKKAPLTCIISNMASVDGLEASWYEYGTEIKLTTVIENSVYHDSGYSTKAIATVCADDWLKKKFECRVRHPDLTSPKREVLAKDNGQEPQTPAVLLFPPHQDELNRKERVSMTCLVKGFSPKDIFVRWTCNDEVVDKYVVTTEPMEESYSYGRSTYILYSTLTVNFEEWNSGKTYNCVVGHESLPLQAIQRSIDKTTGKSSPLNVSLVLSDNC